MDKTQMFEFLRDNLRLEVKTIESKERYAYSHRLILVLKNPETGQEEELGDFTTPFFGEYDY
jgi:hypothetical protein